MNFAEKRISQRYKSMARARINNNNYGEILLKDISITGCRLESTVAIDLEKGTQYKIEIIPENAAAIGRFEITAELKWIESGGYSTYFGFSIIKSPTGKMFQRYVDYLTWRPQGTSEDL